ncbi:TRAP transporter permease [Rubeoparvulum massiliense]|uniref:TRAP transporter permease n=1 Tax=Rubeoparvulum massiliense TaxID=1631346 RepID=UPI00065E7E0C|nr:TRAP transporter permease [Rubeoparvulum massiliense]
MQSTPTQTKQYDLEESDRNLHGFGRKLIAWIAIALSLYHFYTAGFGLLLGSRTHLILHLTVGLVIIYLLYPIKKGLQQTTIPWYDLLLSGYALFVGIYIITNQQSQSILSMRMTALDLMVAISLVLLVIEATRRVVGLALVIIAGTFIAYFFLGEWFPGMFFHKQADFERFFYLMTYSDGGLFGTPISVSANYVYIFILFGAILDVTGGGKMFINLALRGFGRFKGGPAKAAVVASGMMGSISGSSTANAVTTGTFTIPLMKRVGFKPHIAGGVEVAASSSGQFLPPVMGAAAFLMVEYTGIPYGEIIVSAAIPAILSYIAILFMVHLEALKHNIEGLPKSELVSGRKTLAEQGYLVLPIIVLVFFLVAGRSVNQSAFFSIVFLLAISFFTYGFQSHLKRGIFSALIVGGLSLLLLYLNDFITSNSLGMHLLRNWHDQITILILAGIGVSLFVVPIQRKVGIQHSPTPFRLSHLGEGLEKAAKNALSVIVACATAGILIGVLGATGLPGKLSNFILGFSADIANSLPAFMAIYAEQVQLYLGLFFTVIVCLILGLGLPTTATYVILASLVAPALVELGLPVMAAHLFVLYYGILADDTPPINLPAYAAAGIANADPVRTGLQGFKFDSGALLLPFAFATNTNLLLINDVPWYILVQNIITALIGILAFSSFIQNWLGVKYRWWERILALIAALVLIHGGWETDILGIIIFSFLFLRHRIIKRNMVQLPSSV